jgi:DNA-binding GntR family transcriptional regulator
MTERRPKPPLSETAYQELRDRIITLALSPGARLNEGRLERELSIGRTPVREALLRLVNEGFLRSVPGRGFFVRDITIDGVRELFEAVMILERGGIALAARRITAAELSRLEAVHREISAAMAARRYLDVTRLNSRFHRIIHEAARNGFLTGALYHLEPQYHRLAYLCFSEETEPAMLSDHFARVADGHAQLIDSLRHRDEKAAVAAITAHIGLFHARVSRYLFPPMPAIEAARGCPPAAPGRRRKAAAQSR